MREMATELPASACELIGSWEHDKAAMTQRERVEQRVQVQREALEAYQDYPWYDYVIRLADDPVQRQLLLGAYGKVRGADMQHRATVRWYSFWMPKLCEHYRINTVLAARCHSVGDARCQMAKLLME